MTTVLVITNKNDVTSDFIVKHLALKNISFYRLNTEEIGISVQLNFDYLANSFTIIDSIKKITVNLLAIKSVYFRRPEVHNNFIDVSNGEKRFLNLELSTALEGIYKILSNAFWLNHIESIRNAENKPYQLILALETGFKIPPTLITNVAENAMTFYHAQDNSCIIKPLKSGLVITENEEQIIFTTKVNLEQNNIGRISMCPVYFQKLLKKRADVRVTVVGNKLFAAKIHSQDFEDSIVDWRKTSETLPYSKLTLPEIIQMKCFRLVKKLGLNFGAFDFILDDNDEYIFLEINPNGQWAWIETQLNYPISETITNLLIEKAVL